jgi:hypothetical protein
MKSKIITITIVIILFFSSNATATCSSNRQVLQLISKLSNDIGLMADRILLMADKIGEMSNRIVRVEESIINFNKNNSNTLSTIVISSDSNDFVNKDQIPRFTINTTAPQILIYISSTLVMKNNTTSILINNYSDLAQHWAELKIPLNQDKIYIAIKVIDGNTISSLSNVLTYNVLN